LRPGQKKTVAFTLGGEKLSYWDVKTHGYIVEPGASDVLVVSSSDDLRVQTRIQVNVKTAVEQQSSKSTKL
jgi:beta-glucosidase